VTTSTLSIRNAGMVLRSTIWLGSIENVAAAVDQHEVALRAETAKVQGGDAAARIVREGRRTRNDLRQGVDHLLDVDGAGERELFVLHDGSGLLEVRSRR
jgi:hypothetical protein